MKRLLCIRLPSWPIQRLVVAQPALNGRVLILHARDPRRGQRVVACSKAAYRGGVRPGMSLSEAASLDSTSSSGCADSAPSSRASDRASRSADTAADAAPYLAEHDPLADAEALDQLAEWCERFSPLIGFESLEPETSARSSSQRRSDCLYLDVTNLASYFGGERQLASLVATSFSARGYLARVAIADTLGAAWAFSQYALHEATSIDPADASPRVPRETTATGVADQSPAHSCSNSATPISSFLVVPSTATCAALQQLPIQALRLPQDTVSLLQQLGIFQIAQLARLPRASLLSRFGPLLLQRWDQAFGTRDEVLIAHHRDPPFQTEWVLEHPTGDQGAIQTVFGELTRRLSNWLSPRGEGVIQCHCRLTCNQPDPAAEPFSPLALRIGLFRPTACAEHLQQLIQMQLDQLFLPGPVERIVLSAAVTAPLERRQRELFSDAVRYWPGHLARLVDRLSSRLGSNNVVRATLRSEAQPELAYGYLPLAGGARHARPAAAARRSGTARRTRPRKGSTHRSAPARHAATRRLIRPVQLRSSPLPLDVVALAPDGPPVQLLLHKQTYRITRCWGPERIETGWWRGHSVRRDYYRVETQAGHWLWIFRCVHDGKWFLQGLFG